jgi:signal transduction histidine kinase/ActR/RegA family two-component response regulator
MSTESIVERSLRILHIEDSPFDAEIIRERLSDAGYSFQIDWVSNQQEFTSYLETGVHDLVLADYQLPGFGASAALSLTQSLCPGIPFICVSGAIGEENAVELLKQGATDYVLKDRLDKLPMSMKRALDEVREHKARMLAEEEKTKLEAQLRQAQKMETVGQLAGGVAHDFNNMLSVILGYTEMALITLDEAQPLFTYLNEIRRAAERSADITRQLLAFARKQTIAPKVLDVNETVEGMLKMLQRLIGENIALNWQPSSVLWQVKVDPSQIDQILANLCINARDAISGVGKITIETGNRTFDEDYCARHAGFVPGDFVRISVSDNGCGMDREMLDHIFEPFFTTKVLGEGTGLGLATVYGIVKQNNGFINVYSEPCHGTTFTIYLPRHTAKSKQAKKHGPTRSVTRGNEAILLVEDEQVILDMVTMMLESFGYTVLAASTPREAISRAENFIGKIQLLMTDVIMPEMNGRELEKILLTHYPSIKRLFMSGYTASVIAHHGVLDEGVNFIQKPFSLQGLAAKVREALDKE